MAKQAGSLWVDGETLRFVASNGVEYSLAGTYVSTPAGAKVGSIWVEGAYVRFIGASGNLYYINTNSLVAARAGAKVGSAWIQNTDAAAQQLHIIDASGNEQRVYYHLDSSVANPNTPHSDTYHADGSGLNYNDGSHTDHTDSSGHNDQHGNPHQDDHGDNSGSDYTDHDDGYTDHHTDHTDSHSDHTDHVDYLDHSDNPHGDGYTHHEDNASWSETKNNGTTTTGYAGSHTDAPWNYNTGGYTLRYVDHEDNNSGSTYPHNDGDHGDDGYARNSHGDSGYVDHTDHTDSTNPALIGA